MIAVGQRCLDAELERKPSGRLFTDLANSSHGGVGAASLANNLSKTYRPTNFAKVQSNWTVGTEKVEVRWRSKKSTNVIKSVAKFMAGRLLKIISDWQLVVYLLVFCGRSSDSPIPPEFRTMVQNTSDCIANTKKVEDRCNRKLC